MRSSVDYIILSNSTYDVTVHSGVTTLMVLSNDVDKIRFMK